MSEQLERYWQKRFDNSAESSNLDYEMSFMTKHSLERRKEIFFRIFDDYIHDREKILDIGCGPGTYVEILLKRGHDVLGIDYSEGTIKKAVKRNSKVKYGVGNIYSLPFKNEVFEVVVSIGLFQCISEEEKAIMEIKRILNESKGTVIICTLNVFSIRRVLLAKKVKHKLFNPFALRKLLTVSGFKSVEIFPVVILPKNLIFLENWFEKLNDFSSIFIFLAHAFFVVGIRNSINQRKE